MWTILRWYRGNLVNGTIISNLATFSDENAVAMCCSDEIKPLVCQVYRTLEECMHIHKHCAFCL